MFGFKKPEKGLRMFSDSNEMEDSNVAIRVSNVSKCYAIYDNPRDRLKQFYMPRLQKIFGFFKKSNYYREFWALKNISFEVKKGETFALIGRNGSGKSTLLQIICGTLNPTSGSIQTNGRIAALLELGSGFNPEFTGRENVYMYAAVLGLSRSEIDVRFNQIVEFADIGDFIEQSVKTYSSGMLVRLAFAVIAHVDADILVVDEALSVGDAFFTQKCMRFLRNFMKTGTVLFVSHDTGAVVNLCNQAALINKGQKIAEGTPKDIIAQYLSSLYAESQAVEGASTPKDATNVTQQNKQIAKRDMRETLFNNSTLRNDIEVFDFQPEVDGFGTGEAKIISVDILDANNQPLSWIVGGEDVALEIHCQALQQIISPIVGFQFKDRLGQVVFCDNTFIVYRDSPHVIKEGEKFVGRFEFCLPRLPTGEYTISPAIAAGTQEEHIQHQWIHDALVVKVHASSVCFGLVGLPMKQIRLEIV